MNVYDFDKTIYSADSTAAFFLFCLRRYPAARARLPLVLGSGALYKLRLLPLERFKARLYGFLRYLPDTAQAVRAFWDGHMAGISPWYLAQKRDDDVIISASPAFLVEEACRRLGVSCLASPVDSQSGALLGPNCRGEEKVRRFFREYPEGEVEEFYSDSLSDAPMAALAKRAYLVRRGTLRPWP